MEGMENQNSYLGGSHPAPSIKYGRPQRRMDRRMPAQAIDWLHQSKSPEESGELIRSMLDTGY